MSFVFRVSDLAGNVRSELPGASSKRFGLSLGSMGTSTVGVRVDHPDADFLLAGNALLRVDEYDDDFLRDGTRTLHAHHLLIGSDEVSDEKGGSVVSTFADPFWVVMAGRLCGKSAAGYSMGSALAPVDRTAIIADLVTQANVLGPSGLRIGQTSSSGATYVNGWYYKPIGEGIAELGAALDGPDWTVRPIDWTAGAGGRGVLGVIGELDVKNVIGEARANVAFELGEDGLNNVRGYKRAVSFADAGNRLYNLPPGFPTSSSPVLTSEDTAAQDARFVLERVVTFDSAVDDLRQKLLDYHLSIRKSGRQVITFDPVRAIGGRVPRFGRSFGLGDSFAFRASAMTRAKADVTPTLTKRIDVLVRLYSIDVTVDELGVGTPSLKVVPT